MLKKILFLDKQSNININSKYIISKDNINEIKHVVNNLIDFRNITFFNYKKVFKFLTFQLPNIYNNTILEFSFCENQYFNENMTINISSIDNNNLFYIFKNNIFLINNNGVFNEIDSNKTILIDISNILKKNTKYYRYRFYNKDLNIYTKYKSNIVSLHNYYKKRNTYSIKTILNNISDYKYDKENLISTQKIISNKNSSILHTFLFKNYQLAEKIKNNTIYYINNKLLIQGLNIFDDFTITLNKNKIYLNKIYKKKNIEFKTEYLIKNKKIFDKKNIELIPNYLIDFDLFVRDHDGKIVTSLIKNHEYTISIFAKFLYSYIEITNNEKCILDINESELSYSNNILKISNNFNKKNDISKITVKFKDDKYVQLINKKIFNLNINTSYPYKLNVNLSSHNVSSINNIILYKCQLLDENLNEMIIDEKKLTILLFNQSNSNLKININNNNIIFTNINKNDNIKILFSYEDKINNKTLYNIQNINVIYYEEFKLNGTILLANNNEEIVNQQLICKNNFYENFDNIKKINLTKDIINQVHMKIDNNLSNIKNCQILELLLFFNKNNYHIVDTYFVKENNSNIQDNLNEFNIVQYSYSLSDIYLNNKIFNLNNDLSKRFNISGRTITLDINQILSKNYFIGFKNIFFSKRSQIISLKCTFIRYDEQEQIEEFMYDNESEIWIIKNIPLIFKQLKNITINFLYLDSSINNIKE